MFSFFIIFFGGFTLLYKMEHVYLVIVRIYLVEFELHRDVRDGPGGSKYCPILSCNA